MHKWVNFITYMVVKGKIKTVWPLSKLSVLGLLITFSTDPFLCGFLCLGVRPWPSVLLIHPQGITYMLMDATSTSQIKTLSSEPQAHRYRSLVVISTRGCSPTQSQTQLNPNISWPVHREEHWASILFLYRQRPPREKFNIQSWKKFKMF